MVSQPQNLHEKTQTRIDDGRMRVGIFQDITEFYTLFLLKSQGTKERQRKEVELSIDLLRKFPNYQDKNLDQGYKAVRLSARKK